MKVSETDTMRFPEYGQGPFIERNEAEHVRKLVASLAAGRPIDVRAVAFTGERGVGKTWLLRHLAEIDLNCNGTQAVVGNSLNDSATGGISDVHSLYLSLQDWTDEPEAAAKALIIAVDEQISKWTTLKPTTMLGGGDTASLGDLSRWLEADVRSLLGDKTTALVLLLDHAHESPWDLLKLLDQHVLGPLTAIPQVFVVIAGRGKPYPWQAPDLRLHMELIEIRPFDVEQTRQQLKGQQEWALSEQEITEIWELSGGYPRTNYALGCLGRDRWREAIEGELQYMLEPVPEQHRQTVRECLEALCVLEGFRERTGLAYAGLLLSESRLHRTTPLRGHRLQGGALPIRFRPMGRHSSGDVEDLRKVAYPARKLD